jgi:peptidoglycan hydrolase CwlO-like protein
MTQVFIQLVQSVTGAVIMIVGLLLVAAVIGYVSAWFYAKSIYTPIIKGLEADKEELNRQITGLKSEIAKLNSTVDSLNQKIGDLEKDIARKDNEIKELMKPKKADKI